MKLSATQRRGIFAGDQPRIAFPGDKPCPVAVGYEHALSSNVSIRVTGIRRAKSGEHVLQYITRDFRSRQLRRVPPSTDFERLRGDVVHPPTADEIREAAEKSAYGGGSKTAVTDAGDPVTRAEQEAITKDGLTNYNIVRAEHVRKREERALAAQLRQAMAEARKAGQDISPEVAKIREQIAALRRKVAA